MGSKQVRQLRLQACLLLVSASSLVHMHWQRFRLQLVLRMLLFLMTMSMLKEAALMLQLRQCQIDVLMRFSRLSP
jgi:hypothetical protein